MAIYILYLYFEELIAERQGFKNVRKMIWNPFNYIFVLSSPETMFNDDIIR